MCYDTARQRTLLFGGANDAPLGARETKSSPFSRFFSRSRCISSDQAGPVALARANGLREPFVIRPGQTLRLSGCRG